MVKSLFVMRASLLCLVLSVLSAAHSVVADVKFSRTVSKFNDGTFNLNFKSGCKGKDKFGDKACGFDWGQVVEGTVAGSLNEDLNADSKVHLHVRLDGFIPFSLSCPVCGGKCGFEIPIIGKRIDIPLPPCPIKAGKIGQPFTITLPEKCPTEVLTTLAGTVTAKNDLGIEVLKVKFKGSLKPDSNEASMIE